MMSLGDRCAASDGDAAGAVGPLACGAVAVSAASCAISAAPITGSQAPVPSSAAISAATWSLEASTAETSGGVSARAPLRTLSIVVSTWWVKPAIELTPATPADPLRVWNARNSWLISSASAGLDSSARIAASMRSRRSSTSWTNVAR
jgi:hypothetical protein